MKLHRIQLTNLHSLYGDHSVDLDADLQGAPLFLIQGPTGSGKSTLMDAVSLALFGTTPRMDRRRKNKPSSKDVAEQIMSRGAGTAQASVEFSKLEAASGQRCRYRAIWAARRAHKKPDGAIQAVDRSIERIGPDGQATLLVSDHRDKVFAPIFFEVLEGFTPQDFQRSMLLAQGRFDAMLHAEPAERAEILERITETADFMDIGARAATMRGAWRGRLEQLGAEAKALSPVGPQQLAELERAAESARSELAEHDTLLQELKRQHAWLTRQRQLEVALEQAKAQHAQIEQERERVRIQLDSLAEHERCGEALAQLEAETQAEQRLASVQSKLTQLHEQLPVVQQQVRQADRDAAHAHQRAEQAAAALEALRAPVQHAVDSQRELQRLQAQRDALVTRIETIERQIERLGEDAKSLGESHSQAQEQLGQASKALTELGVEPPREPDHDALLEQVGELRELLRERAASLQAAKATMDGWDGARREQGQRDQNLAEAQAAVQDALAGLEPLEGELEEAEARLSQAQAALEPLERIAALGAQREQLQDGAPCPLCGSLEHPYLDDPEQRRQTDAVLQELEQARQRHAEALRRSLEAQEALQGARTHSAALQARAQSATDEANRARERADQLAQRARQEIEALELPPETKADDIAAAQGQLRERDDALRQAQQRLRAAHTRAREAASQLREAEQEQKRAEIGLAERRQELTEQASELEEARETHRHTQTQLLERWAAALALDAPDTAERPDAAAEPQVLLASQGRRVRQLEGAAQQRDKAAGGLRAELEKAAGQRQALDVQQGELREECEACTAQLDASLAQLEIGDRAELASRRLPAARFAALQTLRQSLHDRQTKASAALELGRGQREEHNAARPEALPEEADQATLEAQIQAGEAERAERDQAREAAAAALLAAQQDLERSAQAHQRLAEAEAQAEVWFRLHELIGVNDGKRFREFAQALNLDLLLARANRHLERLRDRYRLRTQRDPESGLPTLEFVVQDRDLQGATRSLDTLSGGESFLVSLALALGLSDLRTSSMPVETLMLDEGFGTLDPQTLETALAALQQLQSSGRQVGIISHVVGLQERIEARILVEPMGEGRSRVRVP